jgi:glutaredoxin
MAFANKLDFSDSELPDHRFIVLSIEGCRYCDMLWEEMENIHSTGLKASVRCQKMDVTDMVRHSPERKELFVQGLELKSGYVRAENGRVMFPIVLYNGNYIGGYREGNHRFVTLMQNLHFSLLA